MYGYLYVRVYPECPSVCSVYKGVRVHKCKRVSKRVSRCINTIQYNTSRVSKGMMLFWCIRVLEVSRSMFSL